MNTERDFITEHRRDLLTDLDQWLRIPGISAQPEHHADVHRSADWLAAAARQAGFPTVEIWPTPGLPAVF
ncbi:MAG: peptidase M20, partial [Actinomycetota bacterium]|nr:peptidase M20 [Actinomycetota bacterium]